MELEKYNYSYTNIDMYNDSRKEWELSILKTYVNTTIFLYPD